MEELDFHGQGCAWKASCQGNATWEHPYASSSEIIQYICTEEQTAEAEGLPVPFSDWTQYEEKVRDDNNWKIDCAVPGEDCDPINLGAYICTERFDQLDISGETFVSGNNCQSEY